MTSSTTPSARRPSAGPSFDSRSRRGWPSTSARRASRTTTGWAQLPPTQPSIVPSGWTMPADAGPGRRRPLDRDDGGDRERPAARLELGDAAEDAFVRAWPQATPFSWRIARPSAGVIGMSMLVTPRCDERVHHGVGDRRRGADGRRLPHALGAQRMVRRGGDRLARLPGRGLHRRRQQVVHERPGEVVALLVVRDLLVQRRGEAHRQAAVDLPVHDHRVDDVAAVVDRDEAPDLDLPGALVDVDDADVAAEREGQVGRVVVVDRLEAGLHPLGMIGVGREGELRDGLDPVRRALDAPFAVASTRGRLGEHSSRCAASWRVFSRILRAATAVAAPATGVEREA